MCFSLGSHAFGLSAHLNRCMRSRRACDRGVRRRTRGTRGGAQCKAQPYIQGSPRPIRLVSSLSLLTVLPSSLGAEKTDLGDRSDLRCQRGKMQLRVSAPFSSAARLARPQRQLTRLVPARPVVVTRATRDDEEYIEVSAALQASNGLGARAGCGRVAKRHVWASQPYALALLRLFRGERRENCCCPGASRPCSLAPPASQRARGALQRPGACTRPTGTLPAARCAALASSCRS